MIDTLYLTTVRFNSSPFYSRKASPRPHDLHYPIPSHDTSHGHINHRFIVLQLQLTGFGGRLPNDVPTF